MRSIILMKDSTGKDAMGKIYREETVFLVMK